MDYQAIIKSQLNNLLHRNDQSSLEGKHIHFASENAVSREDWTIHTSNIFEGELVNNFLQTIAQGRSWIHANLIPIDDKNFLITIQAGEKVGNPNPSVNVSFEPNHLVRIIV